jgi:glycerophosphoryl diester phosphodiesterase
MSESEWMQRAPLVVGHRGAPRFAPENTLAGFRRAAELGADGIELDAKLTADGVVVCHHDRTLDRTTNGQGRVLDWTWESLRRLDAGSRFDAAFAGEPIPSLEQVLRELGNRVLFNVELTNYGSPRDRLPEAVLDLVASLRLERRVLLSSFNTIALRRAARLRPRLPLALLLRKDQGPLRRAVFPWIAPHEALNIGESLVTPEGVQWLLRRRKRVFVWTVNDPDRARHLLSLGIHGLITDAPDVVRRGIEE